MAWSMKNQKIRLIGEHNNLPQIARESFIAPEYGQDRDGYRWIHNTNNYIQECRWYEIIESSDRPKDVRIKWNHYRKVIEARNRLWAAEKLYKSIK